MAIKTYITKYGDTKGAIKSKYGVGFDYSGYKYKGEKNKNKLSVGEVIKYDDGIKTNGFSSIDKPSVSADKYSIENIQSVTPVVPTPKEAPIAVESQPFQTVPQAIPEQEQQQPVQLQENPFEAQIKQLSEEVKTKEQSLANLSSGKVQAQEDAGIFQQMKDLNDSKAKLQELQDKQIEIPLQEKQRYRDASVVGTKQDLSRATTQDVENATLGALGQSRLVQAQTDAINTNIAIIDQKYTAQKDQLEFELKEKNDILDTAMSAYKDIITEEQKAGLEERKKQNEIEVAELKATLDLKKELIVNGFKNGATLGEFSNIDDISVNDLVYKTTPPITIEQMIDATPEEMSTWTEGQKFAYKEGSKKKMALETASANAESVNGIIDVMLAPKNREGLLNSVGVGSIGRSDISFLGLGSDSTEFRNYAGQLTSEATLQRLAELKATGATLGALSDQERIMLEKASLGQLGHLGNGVFNMKETDFVEALETIQMANMKVYLSSKNQKDWNSSGLKELGYNTVVRNREDGTAVTGFDFMKEMYLQAKLDTLHQKPVKIYNIDGEDVTGNKQQPAVDMQKIAQIESGGSYTALNKKSGAYGKYQFMPSTMKQYADKLGMSIEQAKTPAGQEAMFKELTNDNIKGLEQSNIPVSTLSVYLAHQQGLDGTKQILQRNISKTVRGNLLANLPDNYKNKSDNEVIDGWFNIYSNKLN